MSIPFVRGIAPYLAVSIVVFVFLAIVGGAIGYENAGHAPLPIQSTAGGELAVTADLSAVDLFLNNSLVALQLICGVLTIGIWTVYVLGLNSLWFGTALAETTMSFGPVVAVMWIVPHGLFEIPALLLASALGVRWTHVLWTVASGGRRRFSIPRHLRDTIGWVAIVGGLLAVAAFVEAAITVRLVELVG